MKEPNSVGRVGPCHYRLEVPILQSLWQAVKGFSAITPKPELIWTKLGSEERASHKNLGEIAPGVPPNGANVFFILA